MSDDRNNPFAFCFAQIRRYYDFLRIILHYYEAASKAVVENTRLMQEFGKSGVKGWTDEQRKELNRGYELSTELHLQIESFYIFAKILLDKIAQAVYFYFGNSKTSFQSHHTMIDNLQTYTTEREVSPPPKTLLEKMSEIRVKVSNFRDEVIIHQYAPRAMKATMFDYTTGETWLVDHRIHPKEGERQRESLPPTQLIKDLDDYIEEVFSYLSSSKDNAYLG